MPIKFEQVYFTYQENTPLESKAITDINLEINDGEFVSLVGHTGSGKSTLIQQINALLKPTSGRVISGDFVIDAKEKKVKNLKQLKQYAGIVFQFPEYQLFEETVLKDVSFGPKNFGDNEEDSIKKAKQALKLVGIDESLFDKSPFELSGGQKRRVAIAGIIALNPKVLILDEPTAGLDPQGEKEIMELFNKIYSNETTIIMVTHNIDNVLKYSNRVIVMEKGKVVCDKKPLELFSEDNLYEQYNIDEPLVIKFGKQLIKGGLNINLENVKDCDSLALEISRCYHE